MPDTTPTPAPAAPAPDDQRRQRRRMEALLARPAAEGRDAVTLADGRRLAYSVRAGFVPVRGTGHDESAGEPRAAVFTVAYLAETDAPAAGDAPAAAPRPVCFVFNGGPGSSSVWLHLGAVGPKHVPTPDDGSMPKAPYRLADNPHTWLAQFDLVFIDPPHTGWSITADEAARKRMLSVDGDIDALAEVMRAWLAQHRRFGAPLYLAGESYGTTRGAALADRLLDLGLGPEGLVLVSCAMDFQSFVFAPGNDLPYATFLPAFAAVAQYHGRLGGSAGASPEAARAAAEAFVADDYAAALHAGARLDGRARDRIERRLAELTGLPRALVHEKNLRVSDQCFFFELLRDQGLQVGRLDARATGPMAAHRTRDWEFDPGIEAITLPYTHALMALFHTLGLDLPDRYETLSRDTHRAWGWSRGEGRSGSMGFVATSVELARAMRRHPHLKVLVASGRYDLGTPYSATDWSLARLDIPPALRSRLTHRYYDAGHMMYTRAADRVQLQADLAAWLAG